MKRIVICFDGTWNVPADENLPEDQQVETNVCRFFRSVQAKGADGVEQVKWYDEGVGSHWFDKYSGATLGVGLDFNILEGYKFLAETYEAGDEVYVLGFSRGAYTARSLVGMIRNCGLVGKQQLALRMAMAYGIYRTREEGVDSTTARLFRSTFGSEIRIHFLGVWDTVGALGIPLSLLGKVNMKLYEFHDTELSNIVDHAYHAIAIDEHRKDYAACLWSPAAARAGTLEQRWFAGAHCDVGGGYAERRLSDITLRWMQDRAAACGLGLELCEPTAAPHLAPVTDSYSAFLRGAYSLVNPRHYRSISTTRFGNETIDDSVLNRRKENIAYVPRNSGFTA